MREGANITKMRFGVRTAGRPFEIHTLGTGHVNDPGTITQGDVNIFSFPDGTTYVPVLPMDISGPNFWRLFVDPFIVTVGGGGANPATYSGSLYFLVDNRAGNQKCNIQGTLTQGL